MQKMTHEQVISYINRYKYDGDYTFTDMEKRTGVSRNTISRFLNGEDMGVKKFFRLLEGLNIEIKLKEF